MDIIDITFKIIAAILLLNLIGVLFFAIVWWNHRNEPDTAEDETL